ncbi:MAG: 16S rRNA (guanine(527)-N(7))-methyltransferase RsmG [Gammaproteobacteria bacterium]|nr:16S rRNA (guanine(527)-N(7))-methyltransferase RsmG [Gammaproteobacteria bacterium]
MTPDQADPSSDPAQLLAAGLRAIEVDVSASQQTQLLRYHTLLIKWNKTYNLTGIRAPHAMIPHLLLDALLGLPLLDRGPVIDVGSGAGLPGLPLAITRPDIHFILLDSNGKKTRFINQVVTELQLPNVDVVQSRVQAYRPAVKAQWVISRAFSDLATFTGVSQHLLAAEGRWLAWKSDPQTELAALSGCAVLREQRPVQVPGITAPRCLLVLAPPQR